VLLLAQIAKSSGYKKLSKLKNILRLLTFFYFLWVVFASGFRHWYMIWNVILAWVPLELASLLLLLLLKGSQKCSGKYKLAILLTGILWLLFYPNSPYIVTDFIHLSSNKYYIPNPAYTPYSSLPRTLFNDDPSVWLDFFTIGVGVWLGYITGFLSLLINHRLIEKSFNKLYGWCFIIIVSFLSGFAIYLGRFIRWNSWDIIFKPQNIVKIFTSDVHGKSLMYTLLFGSFIFLLYIINYQVTDLQLDH
jgi:uncharacterized membrane protein